MKVEYIGADHMLIGADAASQFQPGQLLPSPETLRELLGDLDSARRAKNERLVTRIEHMIENLVVPGVYQGYLHDIKTEKSIIKVIGTQRRGRSANIHTFVTTFYRVEVSKLWKPKMIAKSIKIELMQFLTPVNRTDIPEGPQIVGPRFWPYTNS